MIEYEIMKVPNVSFLSFIQIKGVSLNSSQKFSLFTKTKLQYFSSVLNNNLFSKHSFLCLMQLMGKLCRTHKKTGTHILVHI